MSSVSSSAKTDTVPLAITLSKALTGFAFDILKSDGSPVCFALDGVNLDSAVFRTAGGGSSYGWVVIGIA